MTSTAEWGSPGRGIGGGGGGGWGGGGGGWGGGVGGGGGGWGGGGGGGGGWDNPPRRENPDWDAANTATARQWSSTERGKPAPQPVSRPNYGPPPEWGAPSPGIKAVRGGNDFDYAIQRSNVMSYPEPVTKARVSEKRAPKVSAPRKKGTGVGKPPDQMDLFGQGPPVYQRPQLAQFAPGSVAAVRSDIDISGKNPYDPNAKRTVYKMVDRRQDSDLFNAKGQPQAERRGKNGNHNYGNTGIAVVLNKKDGGPIPQQRLPRVPINRELTNPLQLDY